jgi:hypothetical protein
MLPSVLELTRRNALLGGVAIACLGGCTRHKAHIPTPRENLLDETLALEESLLAAYDAALAQAGVTPAFARTLTDIRNAHAVHRNVLLTAGAQSAPPASTTPTPLANPRGETARTLAATETAAATIRTDTCLRAPRDLAPLLASLAASEAAHAALLRGAR